jgi:[protein-PII] uridylyltransferase
MEAYRVRAARRRARGATGRPSARFDDGASATCSVLEVRAEDRPGLVYTLASTLSGLGLDIAFATVATERGQALDVFYVTDEDGRRLAAERARAAEGEVLRALGAPPAHPPAREER